MSTEVERRVINVLAGIDGGAQVSVATTMIEDVERSAVDADEFLRSCVLAPASRTPEPPAEAAVLAFARATTVVCVCSDFWDLACGPELVLPGVMRMLGEKYVAWQSAECSRHSALASLGISSKLPVQALQICSMGGSSGSRSSDGVAATKYTISCTLGTAAVRVTLPHSGWHGDLLVSTAQAAVLELFNGAEVLTFEQIVAKDATARCGWSRHWSTRQRRRNCACCADGAHLAHCARAPCAASAWLF